VAGNVPRWFGKTVTHPSTNPNSRPVDHKSDATKPLLRRHTGRFHLTCLYRRSIVYSYGVSVRRAISTVLGGFTAYFFYFVAKESLKLFVSLDAPGELFLRETGMFPGHCVKAKT